MNKWNLDILYKSEEDPQIKIDQEQTEKSINEFEKKWRGDDSYLKSPEKLLEAIKEIEEIAENYGVTGKYGYYLGLRQALNQVDPKIKSLENLLHEKAVQRANQIQFFNLEVAKIKPENQKQFLEFEGLQPYKHYLGQIFANAKYDLSEAEERIVTIMAKTSRSNWATMINELIDKQQRTVLNENEDDELKTLEEMLTLLSSPNIKVRKSSAEAIYSILEQYSEIAEYEINSVLEHKKNMDMLIKADRPDLTRHIHDDVESETVDTLIKTVSNNYQIAKDFYALKAKLFNLPKLEYYERNLEYGEITKKYEYEDAKKLVLESVDLGPDVTKTINNIIDENRIDVFPVVNKSSGAFATTENRSGPVYVLLNFTNKLNDVMTLSHELGHAVNFELMKHNNEINYSVPTCVAEVASTFFEERTTAFLSKELSEEERLVFLMERLNGDVSTIFRQIACYQFEQDLHESFRKTGYLTKAQVGEMFLKHMKNYMGDSIAYGTGSENMWVYWSHIRNYFYVYSYAFGALIAKAMSAKLDEDKNFNSDIIKFYSTGSEQSPKETFKLMGIDINSKDFWQSGMDNIKKDLEEAMNLAKKLGRI